VMVSFWAIELTFSTLLPNVLDSICELFSRLSRRFQEGI
jgi:hypothetical protein